MRIGSNGLSSLLHSPYHPPAGTAISEVAELESLPVFMDVADIRDFYTRPLGGVARRFMIRSVRKVWPDVRGSTLMGLGYATPYLGIFREEAERVLAAMPAQQGVVNWPSFGPSSSVLVDELDLPLGDGVANHIMLVHCLEMATDPRGLLAEAWRVLAPGGRLLVIVPNRRGVWARIENSPFGHGRPYSRSQLMRLLKDAMFSPRDWREALFMPPFGRGMLHQSAAAWERVGHIVPFMMSGVLLVEATKQVYAVRPTTAAARIRAGIPGLVSPQPAPARRMPHRL